VKRLAAIDVGSNSVRMLVADVGKSGRYRLVTEERAQTRLASGMVATGRLDGAPVAATLDALVRMVDIAHNFKVDTIRAVATAAVRDASNGADFVAAVGAATGVEIEIASVGEEARLAFLGAMANFELRGRTVILDIGGGSCEIVRAVGGAIESDRSLPLGVVRLTEQFCKGDPLTDKAFKRMRRYVRRMLAAEFGESPPATPLVVGSGGSVTALAGMAARVEKWSYLTVHGAELTQAQVAQQLMMVRRMTLEERRHIPGLPEHRADIIIAGALVVSEVMRLFSANTLVVNAKGLREALVLDTIERAIATPAPTADRMGGVMEFARRTRFEKEHALQVATLALALFDQLADPLGLDAADRQLLEAAAILHDVGYFIGYEEHHKHSYHLITHAMLPGFSPRETLVMASTARYHRGALPARKHEAMRRLTPEDRVRVERLSAILRLADGMDRSRISLVRAVKATVEDDRVHVTLIADDPIDVEVYGAGQKGALFERVFGLDLDVHAQVRGLSSPSETAVT
jgi:exopolyphosphatase/guanosine-5'-triphosphate,3'-diphosphate pyrophosphatase